MKKFLLIFALLCASAEAQILQQVMQPAPSGAAPTPTLIQSGSCTATGTSVSCTIAATGAAHNIYGFVMSYGASATLGLGDGGDVFSSAWGGTTTCGGDSCSLFYTCSSTAGVTTLTATSSVSGFMGLAYIETSNMATSSCLDQSATMLSQSASPFSSSSITTAHASDFLLGVMWNGAGGKTLTGTGGWSMIANTLQTSIESQLADQVVSSTGSYAFTGTYSPVSTIYVGIAAFKGQ